MPEMDKEVQRILSGSSNCFEILRIPVEPSVKSSAVRQSYKSVSLLVHPDKYVCYVL